MIETRICFHIPYFFNVSCTNNICQGIIWKRQVNGSKRKLARDENKERRKRRASTKRQKNSEIRICQTAFEYAIIHLNFNLARISFGFFFSHSIFQAHKLHSMFTWAHIYTNISPSLSISTCTFDYIFANNIICNLYNVLKNERGKETNPETNPFTFRITVKETESEKV